MMRTLGEQNYFSRAIAIATPLLPKAVELSLAHPEERFFRCAVVLGIRSGYTSSLIVSLLDSGPHTLSFES